ncbi:unnamed protein product [Thlaspi arvense]|uniref:Uncharacterized protein n=1 Tax=Thlaspi arvense TaxID=13288 RepID=A0AAU9SYN6_THLAR|nr:unnamed protein product [Thlaspi arvense]
MGFEEEAQRDSGLGFEIRKSSGKREIMSAATPARSIMFAEDELLTTRHEILVENHENLKKDYASLAERFKLVEDMNEKLTQHLQNRNQSKELEEKNLGLLKDIESERSEKDKYKKMVEEMMRVESDRKAMVDDLRTKNDELLIVIEKKKEEQTKMDDKYNELAERFGEVEKECSCLKLLYNAQNLIGKGDNTVADAIVISDDSDDENDNFPSEKNTISQLPVRVKQEECSAEYDNPPSEKKNTISLLPVGIKQEECCSEYDNPPREKKIISQLPVGIKQEECSNGANSSQVNHPSLSSPSNTLALDDDVIVLGENLDAKNNTVADAIVISDDSDDENDNLPTEQSITSQLPVRIKQEECNNGANSSRVNHPSWSSSSSASSSSSSDDDYLVKFPYKRPRIEAENGGSRKRMKPSDEEGKGDSREGMSLDTIENEETEAKLVASDEMELNIAQILDKIESFTQTVSNLLESGKTMLKELSNQFEERLIMIHKEHVEKWQEEIKELRLLDASNEETASLLHNARYLIQNPSIEP